MAFLVLVLMFLSMGCFFAIVLKKRFEATAAIPFFLVILVMYVFGLTGYLRWGVWPILAFSAFCLIYSLIHMIKDRAQLFQKYLTPGVLAFLVFSCLFLVGQRGRLLENWDEFSHWGLAVKNMYHYDALANMAEATTTFKGYPPATALLQYFFLQFPSFFSENYMLMAMNLLGISLMLPVFQRTSWKEPRNIIILFVLCLLVPTVFYPDFFTSLYVDGILALLFGYILFTYFSSRELNNFLFFKLSLACCVLSLVKASGTGLAFIALLIILVDVIFFNRRELCRYIRTSHILRSVLRAVYMILPVVTTLIGKLSWDWYLKATNTPEAWETSELTLEGIKNLFLSTIPRVQLQGIQEFVRRFTTIMPPINNSKDKASTLSYAVETSYVIWIVIFIAILFLIWHFCKEGDSKKFARRYKVLGFTVLTGLFAYSLSLLLLYLFTFAEWETVSVAAFNRYMGSYMLGIFVFLLFLLIDRLPARISKLEIKKSNVMTAILCFVLCFANVYSIMNITVTSRFDVLRIQDMRNEYSTASFAYHTVPKDERVFIITQDYETYTYNLCRYSLTPLQSNLNHGFAISAQADERHFSVRPLKQWSDELKKDYSYLYIYRYDAEFVQDYGRLFEEPTDIQNNTLYKIDKSGELVKLSRVE